MEMEVFFDESGYTGEDVLNEQQPIFTLASIALPEERCAELAGEFFAETAAEELKHSRLRKRSKGRDSVCRFLDGLGAYQDQVRTYVVHKRFACLTKMIDLLLEPALRADGIDFYDRGLNISFCNLFNACIQTFEGEGFLSELLSRFQIFARNPNSDTYDQFFGFVMINCETRQEHTAEWLRYLLSSQLRLGKQELMAIPPHSLEFGLTAALVLLNRLRGTMKSEDEFVVIHDNSSEMARESWLWETITNPDVPGAVTGWDTRQLHFPLGVASTVLEDSRRYRGLQLADIVAGATAVFAGGWHSSDRRDSYWEQLNELPFQFVEGALWPSKEVDPEKMGTTGNNADNPHEFLARLIRDRRDREKGRL